MQEDYSDILMEVAQSLDSYSGQYLKDNIKKNVSFYSNKYLCFKLESFPSSFGLMMLSFYLIIIQQIYPTYSLNINLTLVIIKKIWFREEKTLNEELEK